MRIRYRAVATVIATAIASATLAGLVTSTNNAENNADTTFVCGPYMQAWPDGTDGCTLLDGYRIVPID